jgi:hypothetical protein
MITNSNSQLAVTQESSGESDTGEELLSVSDTARAYVSTRRAGR